MKKLALLFIKRFSFLEKSTRHYGYFEGTLSIFINIILFGVKYYYGLITGSIALKADSFHTLSDVVTSVLVILGFFLALKPADIKHPFGHGRSERIITVVMATLLVVVGYEFFLASLRQFLHPISIEFGLPVIIMLAISIFFKEFIYSVSLELYLRSNYQALKADAWHHRSDSLATLIVLIGFFFFKLGLMKLDGLLGMGVSLLIALTGIQLIREAASWLLGEAPNPDLENKIREIVSRHEGKDLHHLHIHDYAGKIEITLHIRMPRSATLNDVHNFVTQLEKAIKEEIPNSEVTIHCEPKLM